MPHAKGAKKKTPLTRSRRSRVGQTQESARTGRRRKVRARPRHRRHAGRALGTLRTTRPLIRLLEELEEEKIRHLLIGMTAAIVQGVMANTLDVDLWINLPARQYMRILNLARRLGATVAANTVVYLEDGTPVNFVYEVTGLASFAREYKVAKTTAIQGHRTRVLSLEQIRKSKEAIGRDKDKLHIALINEFLSCQRTAQRS